MTPEDIEPLTEIMKHAFDEDTRIHLGEGKTGGPEGYDNGEFLKQWGLESPSDSFNMFLDGKLIGGVILWIHKNNINYLGNIFIDPALQNQGIGLELWKFIENKYPQTRTWKTETPGFSKRNHHFYMDKCGFKLVRIDHEGDPQNESYILEKDMP